MSDVLTPVLVSAGKFEYRWAQLTEDNGKNISSGTVKLAVTPESRPRLYPDDAAFKDPDDLVRPSVSVVRAALLVDATYAPAVPGTLATWDLWISTTDTPEVPARYAGSFTTA